MLKINGELIPFSGKDLVIEVDGEFDVFEITCKGSIKILRNAFCDVQCQNVGSIISGSGNIECQNVGGNVQTSSGDVVCDSVGRNIITSSGDVEVHNKKIEKMALLLVNEVFKKFPSMNMETDFALYQACHILKSKINGTP